MRTEHVPRVYNKRSGHDRMCIAFAEELSHVERGRPVVLCKYPIV